MTSEQTELELLASHLDRDNRLARRASRAIQIARHYRWSQIARRGVTLVRKKIWRNRFIGPITVPNEVVFRKPEKLTDVAAIVFDSYRDHISHSKGNIPNGTISLLNQTVELGWPINWKQNLSDQPHLWRFQLQYHEYLVSFLADNESAPFAIKTVEDFLLHWMNECSPEQVGATDDSWHPYCISRRIPAWLWILARDGISDETRHLVTPGLFQQAEFLCNHLELDLCGNHLFENLTALVLAACCIDGEPSRHWLHMASGHLHRELSNQILPHGEHFELSPMYHCQILGNILKMILLLEDRDKELVQSLRQVAQRMLEFLTCITAPDGEIPLLGDSGYGEAPGPEQLRRLAELAAIEPDGARTSLQMPGPYWISDSNQSTESDWLLFDRGAACCDDLPAHGHCDLLNVVASIGGRRWIVDSGNFNYEDSSMRRYCRSSIAHNVVTLDNQNQCEIWSAFRMGRRARTKDLKNGSQNQFKWATASHNGYDRFGIQCMERVIAISSEYNLWLCADMAHGKPKGSLFGYLHIAHDVDVREVSESEPVQRTFILDDTYQQRKLTFFGAELTSIADGWQCTAFGVRHNNPVIVYRQTGATPRPLGWVMYDMDIELTLVETSPGRLQIKTFQPATTFDWKFC